MNWKDILTQILNFLTGQVVKSVSESVKPVEVTITPDSSMKVYKLTRKEFRSDGIFSELYDEKGNLIAHTLEHSYDNKPKIPNGTFTCVRGPHRLNGMTEDFITFEITGVVGHQNLLYHWGNFNKDSEGCVILGQQEVTGTDGARMVTASRPTFAKFMTGLEGQNQFQVVVS